MHALVLHNIKPCCITEITYLLLPVWRSLSHLSWIGLSLLGSRRSIRQVQISSVPAPVKDAPLLLGAGQGWAQTAGNHMTETVETAREAGRRNAWTGSQLGQRVFGVFPSPGDIGGSPANWAVNINHLIPQIFGTCERDYRLAVCTDQRVCSPSIVPAQRPILTASILFRHRYFSVAFTQRCFI